MSSPTDPRRRPEPDDEDRPRPPPRRGQARPLADYIASLVTPAARRRGFATADVIALWAEIVGPGYADCTQPERLSWPRRLGNGGEDEFEPATLIVRVSGARALLFQHEVPVIVERINAAFGYAAIGRIRIVQRPIDLGRKKPKLPKRRLAAAEEAHIKDLVGEIENEALREALARLGRAIRGGLPNP